MGTMKIVIMGRGYLSVLAVQTLFISGTAPSATTLAIVQTALSLNSLPTVWTAVMECSWMIVKIVIIV